jgi:hypothetical protein
LTLTASLLVALVVGAASANVCELTERDTITPGGSLTATEIEGNTALVAAGDRGIAMIDISDPTNLLLDGFVPTQGQEALDLAMNSFSGYLVVADGDAGIGYYTANGGITHLATHDLDEKIISIGSLATQLFVGGDGGTLYAPGFDGANVVIEGSLAMDGSLLSMVLQPPRVYCALGSGGLAVVDASNRTNPVLVTRITDLGGDVLAVARESNVLYAAVDGVGLVSLSIDGDSIAQLGSLSLPATPTSMIVTGGRIYMASPDNGVMVVDTSLGDSMLLLGELSLSNASVITKAGDTLYVGRGTSGYSTVDATECAGGGQITAYYIPAAARAEGVGTYWVTDVAVANLTDSSAVVNVAYLEKDRNNTTPMNVSFALDTGEQMLLADVFDTLFGSTSANGGLRLTASAQDVKATSRTYNAAGASGTYGQFIPAIEMNEALAPGVIGALLQLQENSSFRTNIGLLNRTAVEAQVEIKFYRSNGSQSGTRIMTLRAYEMKQFNIRTYSGQLESGYALISVLSEDARVFIYASVVDNESGDPIYIPTQKLSTDLIFGH